MLCRAGAGRAAHLHRLAAPQPGCLRSLRALSAAAVATATKADAKPATTPKPHNPTAKFNEAWQHANPWKLKAAVILQRNPVIMRDLHDWEQQWWDLKQKIDFERARHVPAEWFHKTYGMGGDEGGAAAAPAAAEKKKKKEGGDAAAAAGGAAAGGQPGDAEAGPAAAAPAAQKRFRLSNEAAQMKEEEEDEEKDRESMLLPRVTEADHKNDRKSLNRALQRRLYLIIKTEKAPDGPYEWHFPESYWKDGETMRQAAERTSDQWFGTEIDRFFISNAPSAHFKYPYAQDLQKKLDAYGAKAFFYHAQLLDGEPELPKGVKDYFWVTRDELSEYLHPDYLKFVADALPPL
eukprot:tig00020554_g10805.t1